MMERQQEIAKEMGIPVEKVKVFPYNKKDEGMTPYKALMVELFYGNNVSNVYTFYGHYTRPEEETLKKWHEELRDTQSLRKSS